MQKAEIKYVENTRSADDKSSVWHYFWKASDKNTAKCKSCHQILKTAGSSTSSMRNHLRVIHSIDLKLTKDDGKKISTPSCSSIISSTDTSRTSDQNVTKTQSQEDLTDQSRKKQKLMTDYVQNYNSVEYIIAKMAALDGLPFKTFCTSEELRKLFQNSGYKLPSSANSIKDIVLKANNEIRSVMIKEIQELKAQELKFAISLDEWTSNRNRRYININLFSPYFADNTGYKNLGLVRILEKATSMHCLDILRNKLNDFNLSLDTDIICLTTDAASVMTALGRQAKTYHQLCLAHGIHLGIVDVLYKTDKTLDRREDSGDESKPDSDDERDEEGGLEIESTARKPGPTIAYKEIIEKVRRIVKIFKKSPTKTDILNTYVNNDPDVKDQLQLILDCKTRWSSLADMLSRFLKLKDSITKALIDIKANINISEEEMQCLSNLSNSLNIIKVTVEALCKRDGNLITAMTILKFMLQKLNDNDSYISSRLAESLRTRIKQRLSPFVGVLIYLNNPTLYYKDMEKDINNFIVLDNDTIRMHIVNIIAKYFDTSEEQKQDSSEKISNPEITNVKDQLGLELQKAIEESQRQTKTHSADKNDGDELDLETLVKVEMVLYDNGGNMGANLTKVYKALKSIPPTSVESERVFSSAGMICNKIRSSLNDDSLDALVSLRSFYQTYQKI